MNELAWPCPVCQQPPNLLHTPKHRKNRMRCGNGDCPCLLDSGTKRTEAEAVVAWNEKIASWRKP